LLAAGVLSLWSAPAFAGDAILSWEPPATGPTVAGYTVYYGTTAGSYGADIDVGNQTTYSVSGLNAGTYYFAVTAYDAFGIESPYSNEASKTFQSTAGGGCGMIFPTERNLPGPEKSADLFMLLAVMMILLIGRWIQNPNPPIRRLLIAAVTPGHGPDIYHRLLLLSGHLENWDRPTFTSRGVNGKNEEE